MEFEIINGGKELISRIEPMWKCLRAHHKSRSIYFSDALDETTFDERVKSVLNNAKHINIDIIFEISEKKDVGYCITTIDIDNDIGEIESIYIDNNIRGKGYGKTLMKRALNWLDTYNVKKKKLSIVYGNEEVLRFYESFGFLPRSTTLFQKQ